MEAKNLKNFNAKYGKESLLRPESDVVVAVITHVLSSYPELKRGTFIMKAQMLKDGVYPINGSDDALWFNLSGGEQRHFLGGDRGSDQVAASTLSDATTYSRRTTDGAIRNGWNCPNWLCVETTNGRFLAIFCAEGGLDRIQNAIYLAVTKALAMLCKGDGVLQNSSDITFGRDFKGDEYAEALEKDIENIFEKDLYPAISEWKMWCNTQNADSARRQFFI